MEWMFNVFFQLECVNDLIHNLQLFLFGLKNHIYLILIKFFPVLEYYNVYYELLFVYTRLNKIDANIKLLDYNKLIILDSINISEMYILYFNTPIYMFFYQIFLFKLLFTLIRTLILLYILDTIHLVIYYFVPLIVETVNTSYDTTIYLILNSITAADFIAWVISKVMYYFMLSIVTLVSFCFNLFIIVFYFWLYYICFFVVMNILLHYLLSKKTKTTFIDILNNFTVLLIYLFFFQVTFSDFKNALKNLIIFTFKVLQISFTECLFSAYFINRDVFYYWIDISFEKLNMIKIPIAFSLMYFFGFWYIQSNIWFDAIQYYKIQRRAKHLLDLQMRFIAGMRVWTIKNKLNYYWSFFSNNQLNPNWDKKKYIRWQKLFYVNDYFKKYKPFKKTILFSSNWKISSILERRFGKLIYYCKSIIRTYDFSPNNNLFFLNKNILPKIKFSNDYSNFLITYSNLIEHIDALEEKRKNRLSVRIWQSKWLPKKWQREFKDDRCYQKIPLRVVINHHWWDITSWLRISPNKELCVHRPWIKRSERVYIEWYKWCISWFLSSYRQITWYGDDIRNSTIVKELSDRVFRFRSFSQIYTSKSHLLIHSFFKELDFMSFEYYKDREFLKNNYKLIYKPMSNKEKEFYKLQKEAESVKVDDTPKSSVPEVIWWPHSRFWKFVVWITPDEIMPNKPRFRESIDVELTRDREILKFKRRFGLYDQPDESFDRESPIFQPKHWYSDMVIYLILKNELKITDYTQWRITKLFIRVYYYIRGWIKFIILSIYNFLCNLLYSCSEWININVMCYLKIIFVFLSKNFMIVYDYVAEWHENGQNNIDIYKTYYAIPNPGFEHVSLTPEMDFVTLVSLILMICWVNVITKKIVFKWIIVISSIANNKVFPAYQNAVYVKFKWRYLWGVDVDKEFKDFERSRYIYLILQLIFIKFIIFFDKIWTFIFKLKLIDFIRNYTKKKNIIHLFVSIKYIKFIEHRNSLFMYNMRSSNIIIKEKENKKNK